MNISDRIRKIRGDSKQDYFANILGVNKNTVGRWERGEQTPNVDDLNRILRVRPDINPAWLLTGEGEMKRGESKKKVYFEDIPDDALWGSIIEAAIRFSCDIDKEKAYEISMSAYVIGLSLPNIRKDIPDVEEIIEILKAEKAVKDLCRNSKIRMKADDIVKLFDAIMKGSADKQ